MRMATLMKRLLAISEHGSEVRAQVINELICEGYHPDEIEWAFANLCSSSKGYRFLDESETKQMTQRAHAQLVRLQSKGLIDPIQTEAVLNLVQRAAPRKVGLRSLSEIIKYVCDCGEELLKLDGKSKKQYLN
mgnify:CR=1 FL=1